MQRDEPIATLRVPPWSQEAEVAVLGALLQDNAAWDQVGDMVSSAQFYAHSHRLIFDSIGALVNALKPADVVTVFEDLQRRGKAEEAGGIAYLNSLSWGAISTRNARRYAEIIAEQALLRGLVSASDRIAALAFDVSPLTVVERLDKAQEALQEVQVHGGRTMPEGVSGSVVRMLDRIQQVADGTAPTAVSTGIPGLDRMIGGGWKGGKQVILAARPSVGKSSLAQQFCLNLAVHQGVPAAFFSQEMSKDELADRAVANLGRIELDHVISGQLQDAEWNRLTEAIEMLRQVGLFFDDQPALTLHDIAAKSRLLVRQHGVKLIVLDYLQLCAGADSADNRHHQIEALSRGIKTLAKQLDVTFITLSQLNREVEKRASGRPVLSDLKESGAIEEDADIVMLLSRSGNPVGGSQVINCEIPKNRQGRTGLLAFGFDGAFQRWQETVAPIEFKKPPRKHFTEDV